MSTPRGLPPEQPPVHRITSAPPSLSADQSRRQRSYLIQMGIRVVCFVGAVATFHRVPVVVTVLLVVGAVVLPYTAVLVANAGRERQARDVAFLDPRLIGGGSPGAGPAAPSGDEAAPSTPQTDATAAEDGGREARHGETGPVDTTTNGEPGGDR